MTMTTPAKKPDPAVFVAIDRLAEAAGGTDRNVYRAALRTATEREATAEQVDDAYRAGRSRGRHYGLFDSQGRELPW